MWLPILGIVLACKVMRMEFRSHVDMAMFSTAFGPFISEFLFRYPLGDQFVFGSVQITWIGVVLAVVFSVMIGFAIPLSTMLWASLLFREFLESFIITSFVFGMPIIMAALALTVIIIGKYARLSSYPLMNILLKTINLEKAEPMKTESDPA